MNNYNQPSAVCSLGNSISPKKIQMYPCLLVTIMVGLLLLRHTNINLTDSTNSTNMYGLWLELIHLGRMLFIIFLF